MMDGTYQMMQLFMAEKIVDDDVGQGQDREQKSQQE